MTATAFSPRAIARLTEHLILLSVCYIVTVPLQQLFIVPFAGGALNPFELGYVLVLFFLLMRGLQRISLRDARPFLLFAGTLALYTAAQLGLGLASFYSLAKQLRYFFPFIVATALLATGLKYLKLPQTLFYLSIACAVSAVFSLGLYFFFQDFLLAAIRASTDPVTAAHHELLLRTGRSPWANANCIFITVAALGYLNAYSKRKQVILKSSAAITLIAALSTLNRTLLIGILLLALLAPIAYYSSVARRITYYLRLSFIAVALAGGILVLSVTNKQFGQGLAARFAINVGVSYVVESAIKGNRDHLYAEYMKRVVHSFPVGQGLGKPYAVTEEGGLAFTTDVTVLSFLLPFGVPGLIILFVYLRHIYRTFREKSPDEHLERFRALFLIVFFCCLIVSFNVDLFSRNSFVVYLTLVVMAYANTARSAQIEHQSRTSTKN